MNTDDIESDLPWGFHDAYLEPMAIDWVAARLTLDLRVMMTEHQDMDQRTRVTVTGLAFCVIDPPMIDPARGYEPCPSTGLRLNAGSGAANDDAKARLPNTPDGCFLHWFFVHRRNSFIHVCGREASMEWIEPEPVPARAATRALFHKQWKAASMPEPVSDTDRSTNLPGPIEMCSSAYP